MRVLLSLTLSLSLASAVWAGHPIPTLYPDDPLLEDDALVDVAQEPAEIELADLYDRLGNTFVDFGSQAWGEAQNVNTLDGVPDGPWFRNRHGVSRLSLDELMRGPDRGGKPVPPLTVIRTKTQGITPGVQVEDSTGARFVIKFDARRVPELATSAEIISTRFFHAIGYHVPENDLFFLNPEQLSIRPGTMIRDEVGDSEPLTEQKLRRILSVAPRIADGTVRVVASRFIDGKPLGPFRYHGQRSDDPNDIVPHEQHRELRGLRVFSAWLNHDDTRAHNTQDSWLERPDGSRVVKHWLIDFGSTLGSGSVGWQVPHGGFDYFLEPRLAKRQAVAFGFHVPKYRTIEWQYLKQYPELGRYQAEGFVCSEWKNDYPNAAFVRMSDRDAFWAAKIMARFTPEEIRAIVSSGQLSRPQAAEVLSQQIIERQRLCLEEYLNRLNPLDEFRLEAGELRFENLSERYGVGASGARYRMQWYESDGEQMIPLGEELLGAERRMPVPVWDSRMGSQALLEAAIWTQHEQHPEWNRRVSVFLRPRDGELRIVAIDREADSPTGPRPGF